MTVASEINKKRIEGNGVTVIFPANIKIFNEGDVKVTTILRADDTLVDTLILNDGGALGYTIVFDSDAETLTVTTNTAPISTEDLQILRDLDITQTSDFPRVNKFPAELNENSLDKSIMVIQDQQEQLDRALTLPEETTVTNLELPAPNAGKALLWNATADSIENSIDDFNDIVTDATEQAAIATANAALTAADVITTGNDVIATNADVVTTGDDVVSSGLNVVYSSDWAILPEDTPVSVAAGGDGVTTFSSLHWASKAMETVTGTLLASNNLSDVASASTSRDNLGLEIGADVQAYDVNNMINPMTTQGDTIQADATGEPVRLPIGTPGQVQAVNPAGTDLEYQDASSGGRVVAGGDVQLITEYSDDKQIRFISDGKLLQVRKGINDHEAIFNILTVDVDGVVTKGADESITIRAMFAEEPQNLLVLSSTKALFSYHKDNTTDLIVALLTIDTALNTVSVDDDVIVETDTSTSDDGATLHRVSDTQAIIGYVGDTVANSYFYGRTLNVAGTVLSSGAEVNLSGTTHKLAQQLNIIKSGVSQYAAIWHSAVSPEGIVHTKFSISGTSLIIDDAALLGSARNKPDSLLAIGYNQDDVMLLWGDIVDDNQVAVTTSFNENYNASIATPQKTQRLKTDISYLGFNATVPPKNFEVVSDSYAVFSNPEYQEASAIFIVDFAQGNVDGSVYLLGGKASGIISATDDRSGVVKIRDGEFLFYGAIASTDAFYQPFTIEE